jgi:PEP-CTERM motif
MTLRTFTKSLLAAAASLTLFVAQAAPVTLSYVGVGRSTDWAPGATATGTGSFTTKSGDYVGALGLDDLASFSFDLTFFYDGGSEVLHYGLDELETFTASIDGSGFTDLSLQTSEVRATVYWSQFFAADGLAENQAFSTNFDIPGNITTGQLSATIDAGNDVPEPASLALTFAALGAAGLVGRFSRRRPVAALG